MTAGSNVWLTAAVAGYGGTIAHVNFYADGALVTSITPPTWETGWQSSVNGAHAITAVATDGNGLTITSRTATVTIIGVRRALVVVERHRAR